MSAARRLASRLLRAVIRHASAECRDWANAMLRELDFIESDWAALFWAMGSTTAILRYSSCDLMTWFKKYSGYEEELTMKDLGKKIAGLLLGVAMAIALTFCAFGLLQLSLHFFPVLEFGGVPWAAWVTVFAIPETIFIVGAVKLWQKKRPMALGILLSAIIFATHFVMHLVSHWNG
jgi:hypothetical protein